MNTENCLEKYAREVHGLRLLIVLLMHIRAEDYVDPNNNDYSTLTDFEELSADWDDLASSLPKHQWLTGARAFEHVGNLELDSETVRSTSKTLLSKLYRGYSNMGCTNYTPPRFMSPRLTKNGISHIRNNFENGNARTDSKK